jgi:hypothetical protein
VREFDEPLLSPLRILITVRRWAWFITRDPPVYIPLWKMLLWDRRPGAAKEHDERVKRSKQRMWNDINPNKLPLVEWLENQGGKWARLAELLDTHRRQTNLLRDARNWLEHYADGRSVDVLQVNDLVQRINDELAKE